MGKTDPRVDAYIAKSAGFAQPILTHIRELVHATCPEAEETMKWSFPHFLYKGMLCSMAAFKAHCSLGFWKADLIGAASPKENEAMGQFGRITSLKDLPADKVLARFIKEAMRLNDEGVKLPAKTKAKEKKELVVPDYVVTALKKVPQARATFDAFSYSHKKEYVEWITGAKTEPTREKRIATMLQWLKDGKSRNWKYQNC